MTVKTVGPECNLQSLLAKGLTLRQYKDLEGMVAPLSKDGKRPPRQNLSSFWKKVARTVSGLGQNLTVEAFSDGHIHFIAPIILGDSVYKFLSSTRFSGWSEFKAAVEDRYRLSKRQILDAFYDMKPSSNESEAEFILRVEDMRQKYKQDEDTCYRSFIKQLSLESFFGGSSRSCVGQSSYLTWFGRM